MDPDEGIHADIAQEMVRSGNYLVPHFRGEVFRDKPFLYSAAQALSLRTFGMNEAAARVPGLAFALLGAVTTVLLARRMFDAETSLYAALASLTLIVPVVLAQSPAHDVALVPWTNLVILAFWEQEQCRSASNQWRWVAVMTCCVALAFLTKGLIGVAVIGAGLLLYAAAMRRISPSLIVRMSVALLAGAILASPWYLLMEHASPGYLHYYFFDRHVLGYLTEGQEHGQTHWYYYVGPVLGGSMPWLMFATAAVWQLRYDMAKPRNQAVLLLACWLAGGFVFLTVAGSRLLTYSLPLFPPIAILAGYGFKRYFHDEFAASPRRFFTNSFRVASTFGIIAPIPMLLVLQRIYGFETLIPPYFVAILASVAMAAGFMLFEQKRGRAALAIGMLWFPLIFVCLMTWPVQKIADVHSERALAKFLIASDIAPDQICLLGERVGSLLFYLSPEFQTRYDVSEIREVQPSELAELIPPPPGVLLAVTNKELKRAKLTATASKLNPTIAGPFNVIHGEPPEVQVASQPKNGSQ
jgi:4-amino-4-deoxy-L-arabinose transferase-like glycosyltransferase